MIEIPNNYKYVTTITVDTEDDIRIFDVYFNYTHCRHEEFPEIDIMHVVEFDEDDVPTKLDYWDIDLEQEIYDWTEMVKAEDGIL